MVMSVRGSWWRWQHDVGYRWMGGGDGSPDIGYRC